jgi:hypothetical protein
MKQIDSDLLLFVMILLWNVTVFRTRHISKNLGNDFYRRFLRRITDRTLPWLLYRSALSRQACLRHILTNAPGLTAPSDLCFGVQAGCDHRRLLKDGHH